MRKLNQSNDESLKDWLHVAQIIQHDAQARGFSFISYLASMLNEEIKNEHAKAYRELENKKTKRRYS
jgi:hypothetical protein